MHLDRARGPFLNAAFNGLAINLGFICGLHLLAFKQGFQRLWYILLLAMFFPAVFFTQTRSVYLTFTLTLACFVSFYRTSFPKLKVLAIPMVLVFLFVLVRLDTLTSRERREGGIYQVEEVETRFGLIRRSVVMFLDNPVFGVGLGQFVPTVVQEYRGKVPLPANLEEQIQHNHILGLMVELGIVGASFYLMMVAGFFRRLVRLAENASGKRIYQCESPRRGCHCPGCVSREQSFRGTVLLSLCQCLISFCLEELPTDYIVTFVCSSDEWISAEREDSSGSVGVFGHALVKERPCTKIFFG